MYHTSFENLCCLVFSCPVYHIFTSSLFLPGLPVVTLSNFWPWTTSINDYPYNGFVFCAFFCFQESWHLHCFVAALAVIFWVCMSGSSPWSPPRCQACPVNSPDSSLVVRRAFLGFLPIWGSLCTAFKSQHHLRWLVFSRSKRLSPFYVWLLSLSLSLCFSLLLPLFSFSASLFWNLHHTF